MSCDLGSGITATIYIMVDLKLLLYLVVLCSRTTGSLLPVSFLWIPHLRDTPLATGYVDIGIATYVRICDTLCIIDSAYVAEACTEDIVTEVTTCDIHRGISCHRTIRATAVYTVPQPRIVGRCLVVLYGNEGVAIYLTEVSIVCTLGSDTSRTACKYLLINAATLDEHSSSIGSRSAVSDISNITTAKYFTEYNGTGRCTVDGHAGGLVNSTYLCEIDIRCTVAVGINRLHTCTATIYVACHDSTCDAYRCRTTHLSVGLCACRTFRNDTNTTADDVLTHRLVRYGNVGITSHQTCHTAAHDVHEGVVRYAETVGET